MSTQHIAVVGSTDFPLQLGVGHILRKMQEQVGPKGSVPPTFLCRGDKDSEPIAGVDAMVHVLARGALQLPCYPMPLDPAFKAKDRGLDRDRRMVNIADVVLAFFHPDRVMLGGTANVVSLAMTKGIEVHAWTLDEAGTLIDVGSLASSGGMVVPTSFVAPLSTAIGSGSYRGLKYILEGVDGDSITATLTYDET